MYQIAKYLSQIAKRPKYLQVFIKTNFFLAKILYELCFDHCACLSIVFVKCKYEHQRINRRKRYRGILAPARIQRVKPCEASVY